jgi:outer membrane receptor for ferrienterochelin and colicin
MSVMSASARAQTAPTGTISGKVVDPDGLALPTVVVTATSAALQGARSTMSSAHGDYIIPFLPTGDYDLAFDLAGFAPLRRTVRVQVAEAATLDVQMALGVLVETTSVSAPEGTFTAAAPVASSYRATLIDRLPVSRDISGAVLLAPGTTATGPGGSITFSGAMSYEGLFLLDGVVLNETLRHQARPLFIEDAIEEIKVSTANISAEYGRFSGGVANAITRSGGNAFSGSFRTTLNNDRWRSLTPFERDSGVRPLDKIVPAHEMTFGGPVLRDRLWFFTAGRFEDRKTSQTTRYTNIAYEEGAEDKRFETKGTFSPFANHSFTGAYALRDLKLPNNTFGAVLDLKSLYTRRDRDRLVSANYAGAITPALFIEGQYSRRQYRIAGVGSQFTDLVRGTMIIDRSRDGARWNSPTFCAVCGAGGSESEEARDNQNAVVKASYYWSTRTYGTHDVVVGVDAFEDGRRNDSWQSGSQYRLVVNNTIIRDNGTSLYPVIQAGTSPTQASATYFQWNPVFSQSRGSSLRTYSGFLNDRWRVDPHWSLSLGVRWDRPDARDQAGGIVANRATWSPRLSASWDPTGNGRWSVRAGFARYAMSVTSDIADLGSGAGRNSTFRYVYRGPSINLDPNTPNPVSAADALTTVFDWFFANGGTTLPLRDAPTYAGVNRITGDDLVTPSAYELMAGAGRELGSRGSVRVDAIFREFRDFYAERKDLSTGRVAGPTGQPYDLGVVVNTNLAERSYRALQTQLQYRLRRDLTLGANYTLARSRGNFDGETEASGPEAADPLLYPEYKIEGWSRPIGRLAIDERHNLRVWVNFGWSLSRAGRFDFGMLQSVTSGAPQSVDAPIVLAPDYVANPGYLTPPPLVLYYFGGRGARSTETIGSTDLSINWSLPVFGEKPRLFVRFVVGNLFNRAAVDRPDDTVLTAVFDPTLSLFNPLTQTPVEGVHYRLGPRYGQALSADGWQTPRSLVIGTGLRF